MVYMVCWLDADGRYVRTVVGTEDEARQKARKFIVEGLAVAVTNDLGELLDLQLDAESLAVRPDQPTAS